MLNCYISNYIYIYICRYVLPKAMPPPLPRPADGPGPTAVAERSSSSPSPGPAYGPWTHGGGSGGPLRFWWPPRPQNGPLSFIPTEK